MKHFAWVIFLYLLISNPAWADDKFLFAGFAFTGNWENRESLYPYTSKISDEKTIEGQPILDHEFLDRLKKRPKDISRISTDLGIVGKGSQVSLSFALNLEDVEFQEVFGKVRVILRLYSTILAFDKETSSLIGAFPVRIRSIYTMDSRPDKETLQLMFRKLYLSDESGINAFDVWLDKFSSLNIKKKYTEYLQVKNVEIEQDAKQIVLSSGKTENALRNQIANVLDTAISTLNDIPIVPSSVGEAVGSKMALRFSNGNSLQIELPSPGFELFFNLRGFRHKSAEDTHSIQDIYRVLATVKIVQPDIPKVYLDEKIFNTLLTVNPKDNPVKFEEWQQFYKTLIELIEGLSFSRIDSKWLEEHAANGVKSKSAFEETSKRIQSLR